MAQVNPLFNRLRNPSVGTDPMDSQGYVLPEEEEQSILRDMGSSALSGLSAVGNLLDLPGSSVRDLLTWNNPADQWLTPFSHENRVTGREMLATHGLTSHNDSSRWELADVAGFGAEILTDPFSYLSVGAVGRGASAAKKVIPASIRKRVANSAVGRTVDSAGLMANRLFRASVKSRKTRKGQKAAKSLSKGELRVDQLNNEAVVPVVRELYEKNLLDDPIVRDYLEGLDVSDRFKVPEIQNQDGYFSMRGADGNEIGAIDLSLVESGGAPMRMFPDQVKKGDEVVRTGPIEIFDAADQGQGLGQHLYLKSMADQGADWFYNSQTTSSATNALKAMQKKGLIELHWNRTVPKYGEDGGVHLVKLTDAGREAAMKGSVLKNAAAAMDPKIAAALDGLHTAKEAMRDELAGLGVAPKEIDDVIGHSFRRLGQSVKDSYARQRSREARSPMSTINPGDVGRQEAFKGFSGGTNQVNAVYADPVMDDLIKNMSRNGASENEIIGAVRDQLETRYSDDEIRHLYHKVDEDGKQMYLATDPSGKVSEKGFDKKQIAKHAQVIPPGNHNAGDLFYRSVDSTGKEVKWNLKPLMADRLEEIAKKMVKEPEFRANGPFTNNPIFDWMEGMRGVGYRKEALDATYDLLASPGTILGESKPGARNAGVEYVALGDILKEMRVNIDDAVRIVLDRDGTSAKLIETLGEEGAEKMLSSPKFISSMKRKLVDKGVAEDIREITKGWQAPREVAELEAGIQSLTSLFKAGVLTWPSRYVRDLVSGQVRNWEQGMFDFLSARQAHQVVQGRAADGLEHASVVKDWLRKNGREVNAEEASRAVAEMYASLKASPVFQNTDMPSPGIGQGGGKEILDMVPGVKPALNFRELRDTFLGRTDDTNLRPQDVRGNAFGNDGVPRSTSKFGPVAAGDIVGRYTDDMNRLVPFINQIKKGVDPVKAMKKIQEMQVDYSPRSFSEFEKGLKHLLPFYSFSSRQVPYVAKELATNPAGRLGKIVRATRLARGEEDGSLPEYIGGTTAIPLGENEEGDKRFITGLGLMHEDPLSFLTMDKNSIFPAGGEFMTELMSRTNPIIKAPMEIAAGESFFQRGPMGGRELVDMDPTIGRLASNVSEAVTGQPIEDASGRAIPFGGQITEHLIANSPLSKMFTTARVMTDPRKWEGDIPGLGLATNLLTGVRVSDVSNASQESVKRERIQAFARENLGAKQYSSVYIPKATIEEVQKKDPEKANRLRAVNRIGARKGQSKKKGKKDTPENRLKKALLSGS